jgi:uncharacterized protein (DUF362 family)
MHSQLTRRHVLAGALAAAPLSRAFAAPTATVAIARARAYDQALEGTLKKMFDQIGGLEPIVKNKTVAIKLNLTGNPARFPIDPQQPYRTDPTTVLATVHLMARAGAKRIRIIETFFPAKQDMELWDRYGLDIKAINNAGPIIEWENGQNMGRASKYVRVKVPWGGYMFPSYDLNHSFVDCDAYVSMSKLKHHWLAGVTMSLKNNFGITPCSLYGGDCGSSGNEDPRQERGPVCHNGARTPPSGVAQELHPDTPREPGYRIPRIVADLVGCRPIDLAIVDGIESIRGGEGVWNPGTSIIKPGLLLAGRNPVCVDAVSMAVMGYDPKSDRGTNPFLRGDNTLKLAEAVGIGSTDLARIEVAGLSVKEALFEYGPGAIGKKV